MLVFAGLSPHPPIIVPEIGKEALEACKATCHGMQLLAKKLKEAKPDAIFLITPHGPTFRDAISIFAHRSFSGNFSKFGHPEIQLQVEGEIELACQILEIAKNRHLPIVSLEEPLELDHATMVPLYYFQKAGVSVPLALSSIGFVSYEEHFRFGECILEAIESTDKRVAFIASGDLSHRLIPEAPAGYEPDGKVFDAKVMTFLKEKKFDELLNLDEDLIRRAGECGFRPIITLLGAIQNLKLNPNVISYEGPFGVGYGVIDCGIA